MERGVKGIVAAADERQSFVVNAVRQERATIGGLVLGALILRVVFLKTVWVIYPDAVYYSWLGRSLISGDFEGGLSTYWSPLYPLLVGIAWKLLGDLELAGRAVSVIAGSLIVIPTYLIAREFYNRRVAIISAVLMIFYPPLVVYSTRSLTEAVYGLILTSLIWMLWKGVQGKSMPRLIAAGCLVGLAYLTKPEGIFYFVLALLSLFFLRGSSSVWPVRRKLTAAASIVVATFAISFLYLAYMRHATGMWLISQKADAAFQTQAQMVEKPWTSLRDDGGTLMDNLYVSGKGSVHQGSTMQKIASNFPELAQEAIRRAHHFYVRSLPRLFPPLLIGLLFLGLFHTTWDRRRWEQELYLASFAGATIVGYSFTQFSPRYFVPVLPLFLIWAAVGVAALAGWAMSSVPRWFDTRWAESRRLAIVTAVILVLVCISLLPEITYPWRGGKWDQPIEQKMAAEWMKRNGPPNPLIMATGPWAAFYAEGRHVYIPRSGYEAVIAHARRKGITYLIIDGRWIGQFNPSLRFLLNQDPPPNDLDRVFRVDRHPEYPLVVYRLRVGADKKIMISPEGTDYLMGSHSAE